MRTVDQDESLRQRGPFQYQDSHAFFPGCIHFLLKSPGKATLFQQDSIGLEVDGLAVLIEAQLVVGRTLLVSDPDGGLPWQDAVEQSDAFLFQMFQSADALHTGSRQEAMDVVRNVVVVVEPGDVAGAGRVDALVADDRQVHRLSHVVDRQVKCSGERMGGVDDQADAMIVAEGSHGLIVHGPVDADAVMRRQVLFARLRAVIVSLSGFIQHLHRLPALCRTSENQYHALPFLKRWVKCLL